MALFNSKYELFLQTVPSGIRSYYSDFLNYTVNKGDDDHGINIIQSQVSSGCSFSCPSSTQKLSRTFYILNNAGSVGVSSAKKCVDLINETLTAESVCVVACSASQHIGVLGFHLQQISQKGYLAIGFISTHPIMSTPEVAKRVVGNNVIGISIPAEDVTLVYDASLGITNVRKLIQAYRDDQLVNGNDLVDCDDLDLSSFLSTASLKPFGAHKGAGLALIIQSLVSSLTLTEFQSSPESLDSHCNNPFVIIGIKLPPGADVLAREQIQKLSRKHPELHIPGASI